MNSGLPSERAYRRSTSSASGGGAEDVAQRGGQLVARERRELDAAHARVALQLGHQRAERMAAVQLVEPVGGDDEQALVAEAAREVGEERASGAVGPVQVLEHEQQRRALAELAQQRERRLEQATLRRRARGRRRGRRRRAPASAR